MPQLYDHIDLRVPNLAAVERFYRTLLPALGFIREQDVEGWLQYETVDGSQFFGITESPSHLANENRVAFQAASQEEVDRISATARNAGARNMEGPMDYEENYYAVFFEDSCGNRFEVCCRLPATCSPAHKPESRWDNDQAISSFNALLLRPAMYFGERDGYVRELQALNSGVNFASGFDKEAGSYRQDLIPEGFLEFLFQQVPAPERGARCWMTRLESATNNEAGAWDLLLKLWSDFKVEQGITTDSWGSIVADPVKSKKPEPP